MFETARDEGSLRATEMCVIFDDSISSKLEFGRRTSDKRNPSTLMIQLPACGIEMPWRRSAYSKMPG